MQGIRVFRALAEPEEIARRIALLAPRRLVAATILSAVILMAPAEASAQFNDVLRNVMQNMLQAPYPAVRDYPPLRQPAYPYGVGAPAPAVSDPGTIAEIQRMLDDLGYNAGAADGAWGLQTAQALGNFARDHGLPTGEFSAASLEAVRSVWYERNRAAGPLSAGVDPGVSRPSFDCAHAVAASARTICGNPSLARLDAEMAAAYVAAKAGLSAREQAKVALEQQKWLIGRNRCAADASCIERSMTERRDQLRLAAGTGGPTGAVREFSGLDAPNLTPATDRDAAATIDGLARPQEGLRSLIFPMRGGLPVFGLDPNSNMSWTAFFHLVALGMSPNLIEGEAGADGDDKALQFASELLTRPNIYLANSYNTWSGDDEFKQDASRRAFLTDYAEKLVQMAPKPPFEFTYATQVTLGRYEPRLGGFPLQGQPDMRNVPFGWLQPVQDFQWPQLFLRMDETAARRLLGRLEGTRFAGMGSPRTALLVAVIEAKRSDSRSLNLQLSLRRLTLYNGDLTQSLYEFDRPAALPRAMPEIASRLLAPPPGVTPIKLPVLDGHLILGADAATDRFLTLAGMEPLAKMLREESETSRNDVLEKSLIQNFLSPETQRQLLNPRNQGNWSGEDEFARARSRKNFEQTYLPRLSELALKEPFEFAYPTAVRLPQYDANKGGFSIGKVGDFEAAFSNAGGTLRSMGFSFDWTSPVGGVDLFWPLDAQNAERLLYHLEEVARRRRSSANGDDYRMVQVVLIGEAWPFDPDNRMALRLKAVRIYTGDLATQLYAFPGISAETTADAATPGGAYGPDLVQVRLGMSFEEAEKAIRNHMTVGRVLQGRRAFDPAEKSGQIKPLDSGELFVSADQSEMIAILDEPPVAKGRVMAAWRRVLVPAQKADPAEILAGIQRKYGDPSDAQPLEANTPISWRRLGGGAGCADLYRFRESYSEPISQIWYEGGSPMTPPLSDIMQLKGPRMPGPLLDPTGEPGKADVQCGPSMQVYLSSETPALGKAGDEQLDMTLTDIGPYLKAYAESRAALQRTQPSADPNQAEGRPGAALSIKF
jgi:uncharacterized protein YecT (DUF1311 family)